MDDDDLRSRSNDKLNQQTFVQTHLTALAEAQERTDPKTQQDPAGKDRAAWMALLRAADITDAVAGWALDHVYGLSMAGIKKQPIQPSASNSHPDYLEYRRSSDVHDHEIVGGHSYEIKPDSPAVRRLILRNFAFAGACAFPQWLRDELVEALDALDAGTCMPLLQPTKRTGTEYLRAHTRLRLVAFVKFRSRAYATSEEKVREFIGSKINRSAEAIKDWEQRLKDSCLGRLAVHQQITFAINAAGFVRKVTEEKDTDKLSEEDRSLAHHHEQEWDMAALEQAITAWKKVEGLPTG